MHNTTELSKRANLKALADYLMKRESWYDASELKILLQSLDIPSILTFSIFILSSKRC
jgi:hypothetical protein